MTKATRAAKRAFHACGAFAARSATTTRTGEAPGEPIELGRDVAFPDANTVPRGHTARRLVSIARASIAVGAVAMVAFTGVRALGLEVARAASPVRVEASYRFAYGSLPVGSLSTSTRIDGSSYSIDGSFKSGGIAALFDETSATVSGKGRVTAKGSRPERYSLDYVSGDEKSSTAIAFSAKGVKNVSVSPPPEAKPDWVAVSPEHLVGALDPTSGFVVPADGRHVCERTLRTFDGEMRLDIRLSPARTRPFKAKGWKGEAIVCSIRLDPVSGYREGRSTIAKMRALRGAEASFVPLPGGSHQLISLEVPTSYGQVSMSATRLAIKG